MKTIINVLSLAALLGLASCSAYVATQPTEPAVMVVPVSPGPEYIWVNGYWRWNGSAQGYRWSDGYWAPRRNHNSWVDGHWVQTRRGYRYMRGHWR